MDKIREMIEARMQGFERQRDIWRNKLEFQRSKTAETQMVYWSGHVHACESLIEELEPEMIGEMV